MVYHWICVLWLQVEFLTPPKSVWYGSIVVSHVNFLFILWGQKCCNVTNIKYAMSSKGSCPREQIMASNVSVLAM